MAMPPSNIRALFATGQTQRKQLESSWEASSSLYQENLRAALGTFEECRILADRISMFSQNETEDDVSSGDLQYGSYRQDFQDTVLTVLVDTS